MRRRIRLSAALLALLSASVTAAPAAGDRPGTLIDFQAQAERSAPNDLGRATAYVEATGPQAGELARKVNAAIAAALAVTRGEAAVRTRTGATHTWPVYAKNSRQIEGWRMRSELLLESRDAAALSELLGRLQATLAVGSIEFAPAPDTRRKAEDEAALEAIARFREKAAAYAGALKRDYRIRALTIGGQGVPPSRPVFRAMAMAAESAPMPVEAGDSTVSVSVSGQIELLE